MENVPDTKSPHSVEGIALSTIADRNLSDDILEHGTGAEM